MKRLILLTAFFIIGCEEPECKPKTRAVYTPLDDVLKLTLDEYDRTLMWPIGVSGTVKNIGSEIIDSEQNVIVTIEFYTDSTFENRCYVYMHLFQDFLPNTETSIKSNTLAPGDSIGIDYYPYFEGCDGENTPNWAVKFKFERREYEQYGCEELL